MAIKSHAGAFGIRRWGRSVCGWEGEEVIGAPFGSLWVS